MLAAGTPARLSNPAGAYLCNALIYLTQAALAKRGSKAPFGFLHLPYLPEQVAKLLASPRAGRLPEQIASMALRSKATSSAPRFSTAALIASCQGQSDRG